MNSNGGTNLKRSHSSARETARIVAVGMSPFVAWHIAKAYFHWSLEELALSLWSDLFTFAIMVITFEVFSRILRRAKNRRIPGDGGG